jgi:hypothetical protein
MVGHELIVHGVNLKGVERKTPVVLEMHDDDFPSRFLTDLASPDAAQISSAMELNLESHPLYQPVQRMLNVAMVEMNCNTAGEPPIDPKRIVSAGIVIRRVQRNRASDRKHIDHFDKLSAWMRNPSGKYAWVPLSPDREDCDPDPTKRPQLQSGQLGLDEQLTALALSTANTESTTPAFVAPPATCAALHRTVVYGMVPTASSEATDTAPKPPTLDRSQLAQSLPLLLRSNVAAASLTVPGGVKAIDYRWMSDDFLNSQYPPIVSTNSSGMPVSRPSTAFQWFQGFATALRMLKTVFVAFDNPNEGSAVLAILNRYYVRFADGHNEAMGDFLRDANSALLSSGAEAGSSPTTNLPMPLTFDGLSSQDENDLLTAMMSALQPASMRLLTPEGRFQDDTRYYKLRMFFRILPESGTCPPKLVWSGYSQQFQIAPWHATGPRTPAPIPLPDPTSKFMKAATPNCSFQVPGSLMGAMQGTTMSGLMGGSGGGSGLSLSWICGFNIPLITICAFFVLNIFLSLLNIVFFWLPFIKICIPIPTPASTDE